METHQNDNAYVTEPCHSELTAASPAVVQEPAALGTSLGRCAAVPTAAAEPPATESKDGNEDAACELFVSSRAREASAKVADFVQLSFVGQHGGVHGWQSLLAISRHTCEFAMSLRIKDIVSSNRGNNPT